MVLTPGREDLAAEVGGHGVCRRHLECVLCDSIYFGKKEYCEIVL